MTIFVTGGTGFVGSHVMSALLDADCTVRSLVRNARTASGDAVEYVEGDITKPAGLSDLMRGCSTVVHLVGIIDEHPEKGITFDRIHADGTRNVVNAATEAGVSNFVLMSANGARRDGVSAYQTGKWAGEECVREAGFASATIIRPSLIFGSPLEEQREFAADLVDQMIRPFPVLPIFGEGGFEMQPVSVKSVAEAFALAATKPVHGLREFCASGPRRVTYLQMIDIITEASGRQRKPKIHVPVGLVRMAIDTLGWTGLLPISRDQLDMLVEGNTCPHEPFHEAFGIEPVPFSVESLDYLRPV